MDRINDRFVRDRWLFGVQRSVDALLELAKAEVTCEKVLEIVKSAIKDEFDKAAQKITAQLNILIKKFNERECVIAGVSPEDKAKPDIGTGPIMGRTLWMDINRIGIRRIDESTAWVLSINDDDVPGTGKTEELALRLFKALETFRDNREQKKSGENDGK